METKLDLKKTQSIVKQALEEDSSGNDVTTETLLSLVKKYLVTKAVIKVERDGVVAGLDVAGQIFKLCGDSSFVAKVEDGSKVKKGQIIAEIKAPLKTILAGERTALNFLQHLSGIATLAAKYVEIIKKSCRGNKYPEIYDTRKTLPGLRYLEKYAVRCGGGRNHRMSLADMVLFKDNHWQIADKNRINLQHYKKLIPKNIKIEIEAQNMSQLKQALMAEVDIIMLDNMRGKKLLQALRLIQQWQGKKPAIEISGGINLKNIKRIAKYPVDRISIGEITQSAPALDISLEIVG